MKKNYLNIFNNYTKNNYKIVPYKGKVYDIGNTRYFPPVSREWKNSIYIFNLNNIKNFPIYDININNLIKMFFNLRFKYKFIFKKYKVPKFISRSYNKIYTSKAEIKHTNNKAILTVYVYNREKIVLLKKIKNLNITFFNRVKFLIYRNKNILGFNDILYNKGIKSIFLENIKLLRKYKLKLSLNKNKFEEKLLYLLKNALELYYNKKVEFNIVNIKSVVFHTDFFTKIATSKISKINANIWGVLDTILNKAVLPKVNRITEKRAGKKNLNLIYNKYKYLNLSFILKNNNLSQVLNKLYHNIIIDYNNSNKDYFWIYEIIFNSINYKNMGGLRLEVKGRLTKRYRADRARFNVRWKGGLKNIDSSFKGLSSVNYRGYQKANIDYSILTSKRKIGAFAVKGWISGKNYSTSSRP
jgi:hypothetical protein